MVRGSVAREFFVSSGGLSGPVDDIPDLREMVLAEPSPLLVERKHAAKPLEPVPVRSPRAPEVEQPRNARQEESNPTPARTDCNLAAREAESRLQCKEAFVPHQTAIARKQAAGRG